VLEPCDILCPRFASKQLHLPHLSAFRGLAAAERSSSCWAWLSSLAISQLSGLFNSP
jgi:hypothetical protein